MLRNHFVFGGAFALLVISACSGSSSDNLFSGDTGTTSSEITAYQELATSTQSAVTTYRATMTGSTVTTANCRTIHDQYDAQVRPWISQMVQSGSAMDDFMGQHGGASAADVHCAAATMLDELDHHAALACTGDLTSCRAEAMRHADAMHAYDAHVSDRCAQMLSGAASWGARMDGCEHWATTCCSGMMHEGCCGQGMMTGGAMHTGDCCGAHE